VRASTVARDWAIALAAGYVATKITDRAQRALWRATPEAEKEREPQVEHGSSARSAAHLLCTWCHVEPTESRVSLVKDCVHYGLGMAWGSVYGILRRRNHVRPVPAALITGISLSLVIDEALNPALGITPPATAYPASSHLRGLLTHVIYGIAVAAAAEVMHRGLPDVPARSRPGLSRASAPAAPALASSA
jgi:hypothetical protein